MDEKSFKKILSEALMPLREDIKDLKQDVGGLKQDVGVLKKDMSMLGEDVDILKGSVINIEQTMASYADSYKINQHNIERVDTRLSSVEENLGIEPSEDLKVPHFS
ncbi:MAG: hypothetical protein US86_C0001G0092 [Candidatus Daviesbacteria bacterium GW2011_GWA2_38_24]|uniref:Uncharacterized protein n=1 Tax=Candidatus Daviesbacteria bacterium GW2011_GWA2_38_24 TaxID=1618422 RepID=A0A0G0JVQ8_9BACT|nr:MAG: hypothetical protein US86_C0001G0092 [Candidatus Daviesbacteria bacterium GW2011_GWA2_38_24]KKQ80531.1 MAG: hypothetical protein UT01_C0010G0019 [Candidatus Daviesbacteria bacterium GW2011_GWA1_38_7]OGE23318.1 MAG: hypothetical protein A2688_04415 [Candidatus Daviesbacteria bacterium RIFCSPHIGHO2_01_FULL_38_8]